MSCGTLDKPIPVTQLRGTMKWEPQEAFWERERVNPSSWAGHPGSVLVWADPDIPVRWDHPVPTYSCGSWVQRQVGKEGGSWDSKPALTWATRSPWSLHSPTCSKYVQSPEPGVGRPRLWEVEVEMYLRRECVHCHLVLWQSWSLGHRSRWVGWGGQCVSSLCPQGNGCPCIVATPSLLRAQVSNVPALVSGEASSLLPALLGSLHPSRPVGRWRHCLCHWPLTA